MTLPYVVILGICMFFIGAMLGMAKTADKRGGQLKGEDFVVWSLGMLAGTVFGCLAVVCVISMIAVVQAIFWF